MKLKINAVKMQTAEDGTKQLILSVDPISKGATKPVVTEARKMLKKDGVFIFKLESVKKRRSLGQNSLMWRLLTIYAFELNGGRTGEITPEMLYYQMLERYGVATYLAAPEKELEELQRIYRKVEIIDNITVERNGKRTPAKMVKCIAGSSKYTTKQMTSLIDGIFDELAELGVNAEHGEELSELYADWSETKC